MGASKRFTRRQFLNTAGSAADQLLKGERDGRYSPVEVAQWIEDYSAAALKSLAQLDAQAGRKDHPEYRRLAIDVAIEAGLGRFFAAKFRSGVLYRIYERSGDRTALEESLKAYRAARAAWAELANLAKSVYVSDITEAMGRPKRASLVCRHTPPENFRTGQPLKIALTVERPVSVRLYHRHVNQAERWESVEMKAQDGGYSATLAGSYTDSNYPLQYYFELKQRQDTPVSILDL